MSSKCIGLKRLDLETKWDISQKKKEGENVTDWRIRTGSLAVLVVTDLYIPDLYSSAL